MKKVFSRKTKKKTQVKLTPREANEIIKQEFVDSRGNKFIFRMTGNPHSPKEPTIEGTVEYNDRNNND